MQQRKERTSLLESPFLFDAGNPAFRRQENRAENAAREKRIVIPIINMMNAPEKNGGPYKHYVIL